MSARSLRGLSAWLAPVLYLTAVLGGMVLVRSGSPAWFGPVLILLVAVPAGWVLASALSPARADRRCPACAHETLERRSTTSLHGLLCRSCGWADAEASAWMMAEEEGGLERIVLAERGRPEGSRSPSLVDSPFPRG